MLKRAASTKPHVTGSAGRVLVIEAAGNLWGSERALLDLLDTLPADVAVCCPPRTPLQAELKRRRIPTLPYYVSRLHEKSWWHRMYAALGVLRACVRFRPAVVYLNQSGSYRTTLVAATLLDLGIVAHVRIFEDAEYLARRRPDARRLRAIIAISAAVEEEIRRFRELDSIPLHRLYDGFAPQMRPMSPVPVEQGVTRIACVGRLVPMKGQDVLVSALRLLHAVDSPTQCLMIGEGDASFVHQLKQIAWNGAATVPIHWLGFVDDVASILSTCSVLVCPSYREPLGRVVLEAWAAGAVPIVFSGSGGAAEIVAAADGGIMYDVQEPRALMRALERALALDHDERTRLLNNGRSWIHEHCDPQSYGQAILKVLSGACRSP